MPTYTLNVNFANQDELQSRVGEGFNLIIVKSVSSSQPSSTQVAWLSVDMLQQNQITWTEEYYLYGSYTEVQSGATISSITPTVSPVTIPSKNAGFNYDFVDAGFDSPTVVSLSDGTVQTTNSYSERPVLTMGLAQEAIVGGEPVKISPINADTVPLNYSDKMTPFEKITVFLDKIQNNGYVLSDITSPSNTSIFGGGTSEITLTYENGAWTG